MNLTGISAGFARNRVARLVTTSVFALAFASPALADCSPDPATPFGTITCTGTDADGVTANVNGVTINVNSGASVAGIRAGSSPTPIAISINNSGNIQSPANESIIGTNTALFGINSLVNNAGGTIGAIRGSVGSLNNAGTIDGGLFSAVRVVVGGTPVVVPQFLSNSGTIRSAANDRASIIYITASGAPRSYSLENFGLIANNGTGAAMQAGTFSGTFSIFNSANGVIRSAGSTALIGFERAIIENEGLIEGTGDAILLTTTNLAGGQFTVNNYGTINGSIRVQESGGAIATSVINTTRGTINGSVFLGSGNDILYTGPGRITGTVDGGAGNDTYQIDYLQNTVVSSGIAIPTNFERLNIGLGDAVTLTLANGFALNGTMNLHVAAIRRRLGNGNQQH